MRLVAIDPGTLCGWAFTMKGEPMQSGTWDLRPKRHESSGMRFIRFRTSLCDLLASTKPELVAYEEVRRHAGTSAAHVYGGLVAVLQTVCIELDVEHVGIPVATVKRTATGKGNANKEAMLSAARARFGEHVTDDNEADALWIAVAALEEVGTK